MSGRLKRFSIGAAIFLVSLVPFEISWSQEQNQMIKPCTAETTPKKNDDTANTKKKGRKRQKTKDGKKDRNDQTKNSNCN